MVDNFSENFGNFISELNNITSKGNYSVQPKLKPVKPKTINLQFPNLPSASYSTSTGNLGGATGDLLKLMNAIKKQESNNNYKAYNSMYGASGAYQILKSNIPSWSKEALGRTVSYNEFMNSPSVQDAIAKYKLGQYLAKYGAAGAAVAWYGGPGAVKNMYSKTTQAGGYPSLYAYWTSVLSKM
ncbi:transglycosylase SLT domain-containing protein [Streptomyces hebeiensis]